MNFQRETLPNQLPTLFIHQEDAQCGSVQIWFRAGSSLEKKGDEGIAHFLEHMFFKGTAKRPGARIAEEVESFGGEINAFTSFDYTCYYINFPHSEMEKSIHILLDMVCHPQFAPSEIPPERGVVLEEYKRSLDHPSHYNFHIIQQNFFDRGYAHPILGLEENIKKFSREQLSQFRSHYYNLSNALFIVAGDLKKTRNKDEIKKTICQYHLPQGPVSKFSPFNIKKGSRIYIHEKDVHMAQITLCMQAPPYEKNQAAFEDLALNVMGHGESSILYKNLVIKNAQANVVDGSTMFLVDGGVHLIRIVCPVKNIARVFKELENIFKECLENGLSEEDIEKIKNQYLALKIYERESLESFSLSLGHNFAQNGDIRCEEKFLKILNDASTDDVNQALTHILKKSAHISIQLPQGSDKPAIEKLAHSFQDKWQKLQKKNKVKKSQPYKLQKSRFDSKTTLIPIKNGITLIHRYNNLTPTFNIYAYLRGGLSEESKKTNGLHNFIGKMLIKGYKTKSERTLNFELDKMSSSLSSASGLNSYQVNIHGLSKYSHELFEILFRSLKEPLFSHKSFIHQKKMLQRELLSQQKDATKQCFRLIRETLFSGHPYSLSSLGTPESLKNIDRQVLLDAHSKNYKNKQMVITFSGDMPLEKFLHLTNTYLDDLPARKKRKRMSKKFSPIKNYSHHYTLDREQTQIFIGMKAFPYEHKNNSFIKMLNSYLSGQSSELFVDVRDKKGLCYSVQPIHFSAMEGGYWGIYMASGSDKVAEAISSIQELMDRYRDHGLTREQFCKIKQMIKGESLLNIQTNDDYAHVYSGPVLQGLDMDHHYRTMDFIQKSTFEECNKVIQSLLSRKKIIVTVGQERP